MIAEYDDKAVGIVHAQDYNTIYSPPQKDLLSLQFSPFEKGTALMKHIEN